VLKPVLATIEKRELGSQIDYIVYSSDFPYEIDFQKDLERKGRFSSASINGLTYLWQPVMAKDARKYTNLRANAYYRKFSGNRLEQSPRGFDASQQWSPEGEPVASGGRRYYLSVLLGYTSERGNSIEEVINQLRRSTSAEGTQPRGTIYYMKNENIRSRVRDRAYEPVAKMISDLGVRAEVLEGVVPQDKSDVMGAMTGHFKLYWAKRNSRILPGAIVENLTSYGGVLKELGSTHARFPIDT